ncbi:ABC transporter, ATP-binding protein [Bathymodiolus thermophilus thioautotrophic gill symbiont]|uniref:ABC transporter, ATP-binding protein n=1 Tax=Bathymodiolus thermophilus thioautotrophic gill symbiont TaxID=2360 RepID=A0ABM8M6L1_9GAMM|nr:AAA family ATPase [Bathymodiolus thermophilus thioautotrophic gill symbiont]CAB5497062.1 ABC transporter, ATP-binding protein [Bathymodiolus thermophilus thioautotrophic gill symbiont]
MKLTIKNIGVIEEADIELSGLTVIAGENDSGKSTVGKLMFSITKAIGKYKDEIKENKENDIEEAVEHIYFSIKKDVFRDEKRRFKESKKSFRLHNSYRELFHPRYFIDEVNDNGVEAINSRIEYLKREDIYNDKIEKLFTDLQNIVERDDDTNSAIKRAFTKLIYSEFKGEIGNKKSNKSTIKIIEGNNEILNIELNQNKVTKFDPKDEFYFNDSIIIETPMILNFRDSIRDSKSLFEKRKNRGRYLGRANIAFHIKDLEVKLRESGYEAALFLENDDLYKKISAIINGNIKYQNDQSEFVYFKDDEQHNILNVASGIKSFGILQMLLSGDFIKARTLVVLDEPEVHLHPNWQLKYAEIITLLVQNNRNILVTTHSPYMVEALERYAEKYKIEEKTHFYLAKEGVIKSKNNNKTLSEIASKLSEPLSVFDEMDAEKL